MKSDTKTGKCLVGRFIATSDSAFATYVLTTFLFGTAYAAVITHKLTISGTVRDATFRLRTRIVGCIRKGRGAQECETQRKK